GLQRGNKTLNDVLNVLSPLLLAVFLQSANAHIVFVRAFLVRQMTELHGLDNAVDDERRPQSGAEPEKQHLPAFIAAERLHRRIVQDLGWPLECRFKVEAEPA